MTLTFKSCNLAYNTSQKIPCDYRDKTQGDGKPQISPGFLESEIKQRIQFFSLKTISFRNEPLL